LHRFYARGDQAVVASWMTLQDRDVAIADNIAYVDRAVDAAGGGEARVIVFVGFSQGVAMAYRAALFGRWPAAGVLALGGDIPPDAQVGISRAWPRVLLGAGAKDTWYDNGKLAADEAFLTSRGIPHDIVRYDGGHEWTDEFRLAAGRWLETTV
jgi:predicted esterase